MNITKGVTLRQFAQVKKGQTQNEQEAELFDHLEGPVQLSNLEKLLIRKKAVEEGKIDPPLISLTKAGEKYKTKGKMTKLEYKLKYANKV